MIKNYWKKNKLLLSIAFIVYFLLIFPYIVAISFNTSDGLWKPLLIIAPTIFVIYLSSVIIVNYFLNNRLMTTDSNLKSICWGALGGLFTALTTTAILVLTFLFYEKGFTNNDIMTFSRALIVYTGVFAAIPTLLGLIVGSIYGHLKYKKQSN